MFFMVPLHPEDQQRFAFIWHGTQYTFTHLPQGFKHSPMIAHAALATELEKIKLPSGVMYHQYIDDILIGGETRAEVHTAMDSVLQTLTKLGLEVPDSK